MFTTLLRQPDNSVGATEKNEFRFEENAYGECAVKFDYVVEGNSAKVIVYPSGSPVKYLKLRFRGDFSDVTGICGDKFERASMLIPIEWKTILPEYRMPWFFYAKTDDRMACYGVKTGTNCFAYWYLDPKGVTLFLNLTCGSRGTDLKEPLLACEVVELFGERGADAYSVASEFAGMMCDNPVLPKAPVFGVNNWYWAYGNISEESVMRETEYLQELTDGVKNRPCMIIDDGWQLLRPDYNGDYIGAPWVPNKKFGDMDELARKISDSGANPGLWFRPLLTREVALKETILKEEYTTGYNGLILDPSHPVVLEKVEKDARQISGWGYKIIKHDFTTIDTSGFWHHDNDTPIIKSDRQFFDNTKTTATIIKNLYKAIQKGAGESDVIGCNVCGHLSAGIHSMQRIGGDTSGNTFEITRSQGVNAMMRLPTNKKFYLADPDCAAFTQKVNADHNLDFLEMCAITDCTTIASVTPGILNKQQLKRINEIYKLADKGNNGYTIKNFDRTSCPDTFISKDKKDVKHYDWYKHYDGIRSVYAWDE